MTNSYHVNKNRCLNALTPRISAIDQKRTFKNQIFLPFNKWNLTVILNLSISAQISVIVKMDINNKVMLLEELQEFLNNRLVTYIAISRLLDQIATVQTDSEKLLILKSADVQRQLQEGIESLNDLCISKLNGDITDSLRVDNQKLEEYRSKLFDLLKS